MTGEKVFILGLDGASPDVIDALVGEGRLPNFRRLRESGLWGRLRTTIPPITGSAWSSFMTGKNPGKHGIFDFIHRRPGTYELAPIKAAMREGAPFWSLAGGAGKRVCVVNVPVTYPPEEVNGIMVSGMLTPSAKRDYAFPEGVVGDLDRVSGGYRIHITESYAKGNVERFLSHLYEVTEGRERAMEYLLGLEDWDLFVVVFQAIDVMQHELWHAFDRRHFRHGETGGRYGDAIPGVYERMDGILGAIMERWSGPGRSLIVMSDHGAGPVKKFLYTNNFLLSRGFMRLKSGAGTSLKHALFRAGLAPMTFYHVLLSVGLGKLKHKTRFGQGTNWLKKFFLSFGDVDWGRTKAYAIGSTAGQIYLNVKGREPRGIVEPGEDYRGVREEIIGALMDLRDAETGEAVVEHLYRKEELYSGTHMDRAPDIVFLPRGIETVAFGEYEFASHRVLDRSRSLSGAHRMEGIIGAAGPRFRAGAALENMNIMDIAPTVLYLMGLPIPRDVDGALPAGAFAEGVLEQEPPVFSEGGGLDFAAKDIYTHDEEKELMARLKSLGYFE